MLGEGNALDSADAGRIYSELFQEQIFLVGYLDPTTVTEPARAPAATESKTIETQPTTVR